MDASAASWLSDLEMEDYNLFSEEFHINLLDDYDEEFLSDEIASALQGKTLQQQSLSSEYTSKTHSNSSTDETSFKRPAELLKTSGDSSNSSSITENLSPKLSSLSSILSVDQSQMLSFDKSNSSPPNTTHLYGLDCTLNPKQHEVVSVSPQSQLGNTHFSAQIPNGSSKTHNLGAKSSHRKRSPDHAQDHVIAERKRRESISQSFIALAALVPGLKKMDKASVLGDAIKYVRELKERLAVLEEESKKTKAESRVVLNRAEPCGEDNDSSSSFGGSIDAGGGAHESILQVKARVSGQEVLLRIHCPKQKGLLVKILAEIQSLHLFVLKSNVLPFGDSIVDITIIAQMGKGYNLTIKELVKNLYVATLKFMS